MHVDHQVIIVLVFFLTAHIDEVFFEVVRVRELKMLKFFLVFTLIDEQLELFFRETLDCKSAN